MNLMQALSNPQTFAMDLINRNPGLNQNPMIANAIRMAQQNDEKGLQKLASNMAKSNNVDLAQLLNRIGLKM